MFSNLFSLSRITQMSHWDAHEVLPRVSVGSQCAADDEKALRAKGITHVVSIRDPNCAPERAPHSVVQFLRHIIPSDRCVRIILLCWWSRIRKLASHTDIHYRRFWLEDTPQENIASTFGVACRFIHSALTTPLAEGVGSLRSRCLSIRNGRDCLCDVSTRPMQLRRTAPHCADVHHLVLRQAPHPSQPGIRPTAHRVAASTPHYICYLIRSMTSLLSSLLSHTQKNKHGGIPAFGHSGEIQRRCFH